MNKLLSQQKDILLVEPDAVLAKIYAKALESRGYVVRLASDAQNAIQQTDQRRPDLIILELQLPAHSGVEFLHELRSYTDWRCIPVVIHSYIPERDLEPMRQGLQNELGATDLCYKPNTSLLKLVEVAGRRLGETS